MPNGIVWNDFLSSEEGLDIEFEQVPFGHPLYIMYSSGTTGKPKCMVQSVGGILINHMKELMLHTDLKRDDVIFYFTTCGWMMWNWLVSSPGVGATMALFDGSPFYPDPGACGNWPGGENSPFSEPAPATSARWNRPESSRGTEYDLSALRTVCSTGSPLSNDGFE